MHLVRPLVVVVSLASALSLACSRPPTAPSAVSPGATIGEVPQQSVPVPPRIGMTPPRGVGVSRILAFGDSITWGAYSAWDPRFLFAAANGGYPERVLASLTTHHAPQRFTMFNEGVPGELAINALSRFRSLLTSRRPDAVLLLEGINDLNNDISPSRVGSALRQMADAATSVGIPVIVATMFQTYEVTDPTGGFRPNGAPMVPTLNAEIRRLMTGRTNVHVLDLEPLMSDRNLVGADGIHLTDAGFTVMASAFVDAIERAFPVRGSFQ